MGNVHAIGHVKKTWYRWCSYYHLVNYLVTKKCGFQQEKVQIYLQKINKMHQNYETVTILLKMQAKYAK